MPPDEEPPRSATDVEDRADAPGIGSGGPEEGLHREERPEDGLAVRLDVPEALRRRDEVRVRDGQGRDARVERTEARGLAPGERNVVAEHLSLIHISEPTRLGMISYA